MKFKTTKKAVMNNYDNIIKVNYCKLQNLLNYEREIAYTTSAGSWGADIYDYGNTAIVTGYTPFGNINADFETCQKYEKLANEIYANDSISWDEKETKNDELLHQFIDEIKAL